MKNKHLAIPASLFILALFLFSCAGSHPNSKILVGSWRPVSAEKYIDPSKAESQQPAVPDSAALAKQRNKNPNEMSDQQKAAQEWQRMVNTEERSPLVIHQDKTAEKAYHNQTVKGSFKLKHHGTRIIFTEEKTGQILKADILEINDTTIVLIERLPVGDIKVKYVKQR